MTDFSALMTRHHRHCDGLFSDLEQRVAAKDWPGAENRFQVFAQALEQHFAGEETILFPAFEASTGMTSGPTAVMRMEHQQMRGLLEQGRCALQARDQDELLGVAETLLILMAQHNAKEENILYPMCDQHISDSDCLARLQSGMAF